MMFTQKKKKLKWKMGVQKIALIMKAIQNKITRKKNSINMIMNNMD